jgi:hypothetical protein
MLQPMDPQTNQNLRPRRGAESTLQALLYGLAAPFFAGGLVLTGAPPGVRWGMFLIGCALVVAATNISVSVRQRGVTRGEMPPSAETRR